MQVRDGPAAVRGDARRGNATGLRAGKAAKGEPRVRRPAALPTRTPRGRRIRASQTHCSLGASRRHPDAAALAANVKIRVEGKTTTIFGAAQPRVTADNALQALDVASVAGEFYYGTTTSTFGDYVSQIGKYAGDQSTGWVFKVNGVSPPVGRRQGRPEGRRRRPLVLRDLRCDRRPADARAAAAAGQLLRRRSRQRRRQESARAATATLTADGKRFKTTAGRACIGKHAGLVRATAPGAVRSNAVK